MRYIIVSGYMFSGLTAVVDLLKEFTTTSVFPNEFRLISDPYGIRALEDSLVNHWMPLRATAAISDFLQYAEKCSRKKSYFPLAPFGMGYSDTINSEFMQITQEYIASMVSSVYYGDFYFNKAKKSHFSYAIDRCRMGVQTCSKNKINIAKKVKCYFSRPTKKLFEESTKTYFKKMFANISSGKCVVLSAGIHPCDAEVVERYFHDAKMIIVDRDLRDIYISSVEHHGMMEPDIDGYIYKQAAMRECVYNSPNILQIKFEDLVIHYEETVAKIREFCELMEENHVCPKRYFTPEKSQNNVGIWKVFYEKHASAINMIKEFMENQEKEYK